MNIPEQYYRTFDRMRQEYEMKEEIDKINKELYNERVYKKETVRITTTGKSYFDNRKTNSNKRI